jgi:uncharacterized membrane protein
MNENLQLQSRIENPDGQSHRLTCIDALRGLVMIFMALDHTREYFGDLRLVPEDLSAPDACPGLFLTRWITHFCAPTFMFLAGVSAWMYGRKVQNKRKLAVFLFTRGTWLIFLEFTVIYFGWMQSIGIAPPMFIVIAAIGASMIALSALIFLPYWLLVGLGVGIVLLHNLLDVYQASGDFAWVWMFIHESGYYEPWNFIIGYPILAWVGVITLGYVFGRILELERASRRRLCVGIGAGCCLAFVILRGFNLYGEPTPWTDQTSYVFGILSILNCTKYPPSLAFLLMTLGPALIVLAAFDRAPAPADSSNSSNSILSRLRSGGMKVLLVFGQVPLFYYVVHLYLIHSSSRLWYWIARGEPISGLQVAYSTFFHNQDWPSIYGFGLPVIYTAWVLMLLILFPLCLWFRERKRKGKSWFWSYL